MAWKIEINSIDRTALIDRTQPPTIERALNTHGVARFRIKPGLLQSFVYHRFHTVTFYARDGVTPIFGGFVWNRAGTSQLEHMVEHFLAIEAHGLARYADFCSTSLSYPSSVTLKTVLTDLITAPLAAYGWTLDASQVTGPTLAPFTWVNKRVSDALRELMDRAGAAGGQTWAFLVNPSGALKAFEVGTDAAPFAIRDTSPPAQYCTTVSWRDSDRPVANYIIVTCGPDGPEAVTQFWTADGVASSWVADIAVAPGTTPPPTVIVNGVTKTVGTGANYTWNPATATLTLGTAPLPGAGQIIELVYTAQFPFDVFATSGASPTIEYRQRETEIRAVAAGQEVADSLLAQLDQEPQDITVVSLEYGGWEAGQALEARLTRYFVTSPQTFIIGSVTVAIESDTLWRYTMPATLDTYQGDYRDRWRELIGSKG